MLIIIIGPTGSGKTTQAEFIAKVLKLKHIQTGKYFRKLAKKNKFFRKFIAQGKLIPDKPTLKIVNKLVKNKNNLILDGFPRNLPQAKAFKEKIDLVLYLKTSKKELIKRLKLRKRNDDTIKNIKKRYDIYLKKTIPVINFYKKKGILKIINGDPPQKEVSKEIRGFLIQDFPKSE